MGDSKRADPTLIFIIGPPSVGKMTVGQELARLTGFRLFHLHQVVDLVLEYFPYGSPGYLRLVRSFRRQVFEEGARHGLDLITTGAWPFDEQDETAVFWRYVRPYADGGGRVCFAELLAPLETRLIRNLTENRRRHKKTDWSTESALRQDAATHRYDSGETLPFDLPLLRIDTEHLTADAAATRIRTHHKLPLLSP